MQTQQFIEWLKAELATANIKIDTLNRLGADITEQQVVDRQQWIARKWAISETLVKADELLTDKPPYPRMSD